MILGHEVHGAGAEHVIIMHDWQGDHRNYDLAMPFFDTHAFTWAFADLRGYGWSRSMAGSHNAAEASADILALADALGWERFHVVGHSMTGMVVQRLAIDGGARIKSVVAACPVPACGMQMPADAYGFFKASVTDDAMYRGLLDEIGAKSLTPRWGDYKLGITRSSADPDTRVDYLNMFNGEDFSGEAKGIATPMLVLLGDLDHEGLRTGPMQETFGKWYPNAEIVSLAEVGHYPMQEKPVEFVTRIEAFMAGHAG